MPIRSHGTFSQLTSTMTVGEMIREIEEKTNLKYCPTPRMIKNDSYLFYDTEWDEIYTLHIRSGYVRRGTKEGWGYGAQPATNPKTGKRWGFAQYQLNPKIDNCRIVYPYDVEGLTEILINAYTYRHENNIKDEYGRIVRKQRRTPKMIRKEILEHQDRDAALMKEFTRILSEIDRNLKNIDELYNELDGME